MQHFASITALLYGLSYLHIAIAASELISESLLWGPYRPNVYFGVRPRMPKSNSFGLMWTNVVTSRIESNNLRHTCEQSDGLAQYGWDMYDTRAGGIQNIFDPGNNLNLTIEFVKISDGSRKGSWGARIRGTFRDASMPCNASIIWYMAVENHTDPRSNTLDCRESSEFGSTECQGHSHGLDSFNIRILLKRNKEMPTASLYGVKVPDDQLWKVKGK
jgi:mannosyl-oligosaccharide glucosidase